MLTPQSPEGEAIHKLGIQKGRMVSSKEAEQSTRCIQERNSQEAYKKGRVICCQGGGDHWSRGVSEPRVLGQGSGPAQTSRGETRTGNRASDLKSQNSPATVIISTEYRTGGCEPSQELG